MSHHRSFVDADAPGRALLFGGMGGMAFDDAVVEGDAVAAIWMAGGSVVDSVQIAYRNGRRTSRHGGTGGRGDWVPFGPGEHITGLSGRCGRLVECLRIHTARRILTAGNPAAPGRDFRLDAPPGEHIIGLHGSCGWYLDAVGARFAPLPLPSPRPLPAEAARPMVPVRFAALTPEELDEITARAPDFNRSGRRRNR